MPKPITAYETPEEADALISQGIMPELKPLKVRCCERDNNGEGNCDIHGSPEKRKVKCSQAKKQ